VAAFHLAAEPDPALATHGGAESIAVDMITTGNSSSGLGTRENCIQISAGSSFTIDVTVQGVPPHNDNGTPTPADDTGGIIAYSYTLNYPGSVFTVAGSTFKDPAINLLADNNANPNDLLNVGDTPPDADGAFQANMLDTGNDVPESGSGVLERLTISSSSTTSADVYLLTLVAANSAHVSAAGATFYPHSIRSGAIAVNQPCDEPGADDDGDGVNDLEEDACGGDPYNPAVRPERIDGAFAGTSDDGDVWIDELLPTASGSLDCDGDGWTGNQEAQIFGTSGTMSDQDPCGNNGWPADLQANNQLNIGDFNSFLSPPRPDDSFNKFGHTVPDPNDPAIRRWNLLPDAIINVGDLNALNPAVLAPTASPPLFSGQPAFFANGGQCPFPP
jgi:hypothetical protein